MYINLNVKAGESIRAFYLFFIIVGIQIGVGVLGAPRYIFEKSHQDAWLSIIIAYLFMLIITAVMFVILSRYDNSDLFGIQVDLYGKWIGKALGLFIILFYMTVLLSVLTAYVEIVQVFLFPTIPSFMMGLLLLALVGYSVLGGVRIIVGVIFLFSILSPWIFLLLYDPISRMETTHFFPMFEASFIDLLQGAKRTSYTFLGFEILMFIFPFVENKEKAKKPTYLGLTFSAFIVLITTIISIGYYSPNDFDLMDWPVLSLFKSVSFSFMERFDYFIIAEWMMVTVPTAILLMWIIVHGAERLFQVHQRKSLYVVSIILLIFCSILKADVHIRKLSDFISEVGFWVVYVYPIILLPIVLIKTKRKASKEVKNDKNN